MNGANSPNARGLAEAKKAAGSAKNLACLLGISPPAISRWGDEIPLARVLDVERVTGVPRAVLRPDMFQAPPKRRRAA